MAAYLIANLTVHDPARFGEYREQVTPMIAAFGGRYCVRGGAVTDVEGGTGLDRVVILEFPDMAALRRFYYSPEYAPLIALRQSCASASIALVEGHHG